MSAAWACWVSVSVSASSCWILELSEVAHFQVSLSMPHYPRSVLFCFLSNFCRGFGLYLFTIYYHYSDTIEADTEESVLLHSPSCESLV